MDTTPDVFVIPVDGSAPAKRLTENLGRNNGPPFTPNGKSIVFSSNRTGSMPLWKMNPDGTEPVQLTKEETNNWFQRLSPNGAAALFVTYPKGMAGDPPNSAVELRRLTFASGANDLMARVTGGPASAPTFSPANSQIVFVSYQMVY